MSEEGKAMGTGLCSRHEHRFPHHCFPAFATLSSTALLGQESPLLTLAGMRALRVCGETQAPEGLVLSAVSAQQQPTLSHPGRPVRLALWGLPTLERGLLLSLGTTTMSCHPPLFLLSCCETLGTSCAGSDPSGVTRAQLCPLFPGGGRTQEERGLPGPRHLGLTGLCPRGSPVKTNGSAAGGGI